MKMQLHQGVNNASVVKVIRWQRYRHGDVISTLTDPPLGSGVWCHYKNTPSKEVQTLNSLKRSHRLKKKKKRNDIRKALGGGDAFSLPENRKTVKKVNQRVLVKMVRRGKKAPSKNFIKKVVVWGFLSAMREKRESNGSKSWRYVCAAAHRCVYSASTLMSARASEPSGLFRSSELAAGRENRSGTLDRADVDEAG